MTNEIQKIEMEIMELSKKLSKLRKDSVPVPTKNYTFKDLNGDVNLLDLFSGKDILFAIHNMGQGCRYCTLWADGLNAFLPHLEDQFAVVLLSKDTPDVQRRIANQRGWRFRTASHGGGDYIKNESVLAGQDNMPGIVCYTRKGSEIFKKNSAIFGPDDQYCSVWPILGLAGLDEKSWFPQFSYWSRPEKLDDGGANLR